MQSESQDVNSKDSPIARTIAKAIGILFLLAGGYFLIQSYLIFAEIREQSETYPLRLAVDFSKPGEITVPFEQTWQMCHSQSIKLQLPEGALEQLSVDDLTSTLNVKWQFTDAQGEPVVDHDWQSEAVWQDYESPDAINLGRFYPFERGQYTFTCNVREGYPPLEGMSQQLICKYEPCGMETLAAQFVGIIGIVACLIGGVIFLFLWMASRPDPHAEPVSEESPTP